MTIAKRFARRLASLATLAMLLFATAAQAQTVVYYHTDALGSPVAITDAAGNVLERSEYEPYGQVLNHPVADGPGYTGHVSDAQTGLSYMQQRYYDPMIGRFLSMDPVTADAVTGANFNRYWYANNNPYRFKDPDGRQACTAISCPTPEPLRDKRYDAAAQARNEMGKTLLKGYGKLAVAGATGGVAAETGALAMAGNALTKVATAAEAKYTATAIAVLEKGSGAVQAVAAKAKEVTQVVAARASDLKVQVMTSQAAITSMKYREQLTDAFEGAVGQVFGVESPAKSAYEIGGEAAASAAMDVTDTEPRR